jgi:prephenate dehydrogenase
MRLAILGFGLIGGSIARALRVAPDGGSWTISAWSPTGAGPAAAVRDRVVDRSAASIGDALSGAELVVLAAPPLACLDLLDELGRSHRGALGSAIVTDVASTKSVIAGRAAGLGLRFVGGHPMAGRETSGYEAADAELFAGRPWVVLADAAAEDAMVVERLATACRARPVRLPAADHDAAVAAISHLPLVLSAALVEAVAGTPGEPRSGWATASGLAASGWRGMTRLARGDVEMGAGIAATNAPAIAERIRDLQAVLAAWLTELEQQEVSAIAEHAAGRLAAARAVLGDGS